LTEQDYVDYLNEIPVDADDIEDGGGRIPIGTKYGDWMLKNDPVAFNVGYREWVLGAEFRGEK
jgi:hypothetical protein